MRTPTAKQSLRALVVFFAAAVVLVSVALGVTAKTAPGCVSCHSRQGSIVQATRNSAHAKVSCASCHVPSDAAGRIAFASTQVFGMVLRVGPIDRAFASPDDETCLRCHRNVLKRIVVAKGYRMKHSETRGLQCVECHSATAHGASTRWARSPQMDTCLTCHSAKKASENCDLCHDQRTESERLARGSAWTVTHGPTWRLTHGMGQLGTCSACHRKGYCSACHGRVTLPHGPEYVRQHSSEAKTQLPSCRRCHRQTSFCNSCHGLRMPHDATFTKSHAKVVKATGKEACLRCHAQTDCDVCHTRHIHPISKRQGSR